MALSLPDLPVELINHTLNFIPSKKNAIIQVRETCRALALNTTGIFARECFSSGSWPLTQRTISALTGISKNKFLNPALKEIILFRYTNKYQKSDSRYSMAKGIDIKELGQSLQTLTNLRSLHLADFNFIGFEKFVGGLLATLSLPLITDFRLSEINIHASDLRKFIALHSDTIKTVVFNELNLTTPKKGAWSGLLNSLTQLKDVKLIHIHKPIQYHCFVRFEPEDICDPTFERCVDWYTQYDCGCDSCSDYAREDHHAVFGDYRLGMDVKKGVWTRGLKLMAAGSRTMEF
ncbi:uncharacterized protein K441DRAFT_217341 [Cenococcum geophilum 1.58]|uniref:uncharacterized protein n=1 Tax=Cenococcum geophilum 1.58 TaxID=794803 RepID=UPI00358E6C4B|nr:hypothetical protein K441DRAFT_217341 [Cenococcum geophilum 1.58]